jgi:hypothetical protein
MEYAVRRIDMIGCRGLQPISSVAAQPLKRAYNAVI